MAKSTIKLRIKEKGGLVQVKALITHPMDTGLRRNKKGDKIPAHFISEVMVEANGESVMMANWTGSISKNPFISFNYSGEKGDKVKLSWKDNMGKSDSLEKTVGKKK
ncbi:MAG: sulfur-oxidizing protein SoxZ [Cocleimonas sp.]|jgi:sulfur-oxidizing protein SoxZ